MRKGRGDLEAAFVRTGAQGATQDLHPLAQPGQTVVPAHREG
ncbi:hypothetical protein ACLGIH_00920 [Streptomyces sp. HMX87]